MSSFTLPPYLFKIRAVQKMVRNQTLLHPVYNFCKVGRNLFQPCNTVTCVGHLPSNGKPKTFESFPCGQKKFQQNGCKFNYVQIVFKAHPSKCKMPSFKGAGRDPQGLSFGHCEYSTLSSYSSHFSGFDHSDQSLLLRTVPPVAQIDLRIQGAMRWHRTLSTPTPCEIPTFRGDSQLY
uniref:Uncharacterized protein n=2 Tax=Photinus pyralis TaxID=7054 RepID=A0A1Y1KH57_PHOPY